MMNLEEKLWKTFNKALGQFQLIDEDDRILVGLSGGKDSLCLLEFLARRSKVHVPHFTVEALHVRMENIHYETDTTYLQSFCDRLDPTYNLSATASTSLSTSSPPASILHSSLLTLHSNKSPPASSVPGNAANNSSISRKSWVVRKLL